MRINFAAAALGLLMASAAPAAMAQDATKAPPKGSAALDPMSGRATSEELSSVTRHSTVINGAKIAYTATAGTLTIQSHDGDPNASMFYVAYVADRPAGAPPRPVTFLFNGGPGSASHWLNIGGIGPVQAVVHAPKATGPAPYVLQNSPGSILDKTTWSSSTPSAPAIRARSATPRPRPSGAPSRTWTASRGSSPAM